MLIYKKGNIFAENVEAIVNPVNCVGIMGKGLALQFKNKYPENFKAYESACKQNKVQTGKMYIYENETLKNPKYIINFPTKRHWRDNSRLEDIKSGLDDLKRLIEEMNIKSIAIPALGSGLGGLNWQVVKKIIEEKLKDINDCQIIIFEPQN